MKTLLIAVSALAIANPALAQMEPAAPSTTPQSTSPAQPTPPADPMSSGTTGTMGGTTGTTTDTAPAPTTVTAPSDPKALIASEFPAYDKNADGSLNKTEFAAWMGALRTKTDAKPMAAGEMTKWTDGAFATADKDKSKDVSLAELQNYLTQGA